MTVPPSSYDIGNKQRLSVSDRVNGPSPLGKIVERVTVVAKFEGGLNGKMQTEGHSVLFVYRGNVKRKDAYH